MTYENGTHFLADSIGCSAIAMGGVNPHPIEYLIAALGGCTGTTIIKGLSEKGIHPDSFAVKIDGSRRKTPPTVFETIHLTFKFSGDLDDRMVAETIQETMTLKCPIAVTLEIVGKVTWEHRIGKSYRLAENFFPRRNYSCIPHCLIYAGAWASSCIMP